jgi:agmatine/peptidylarginine deiminase
MTTAFPQRLPAEWEPQAGVMLTWPHADTDWADRLEQVFPVFAQIGAAVSRSELLLSVCRSPTHADQVRRALCGAGADPGNLRFSVADSDDTWARDHGPLTTLASGRPVMNDFRFNGWGGKFDASRDDRISANLHGNGAFGQCLLQPQPFVLEGGAIETDGHGTLLATRSAVLSDSRNPGLSQQVVEQRLGETLGIDRFLWLDHGDITGDDTDGHIDTLARFVDVGTIVYATAPEGDPDHAALSAMARELGKMTDVNGKPFALHPLPFPGVHLDEHGRRLPATYANFLFTNDAVLLPVYHVPADAQAVELMRRLCPGREIVPIDCREIVRQNGSLHCLTMQFPAGTPLQDTLEHPNHDA